MFAKVFFFVSGMRFKVTKENQASQQMNEFVLKLINFLNNPIINFTIKAIDEVFSESIIIIWITTTTNKAVTSQKKFEI